MRKQTIEDHQPDYEHQMDPYPLASGYTERTRDHGSVRNALIIMASLLSLAAGFGYYSHRVELERQRQAQPATTIHVQKWEPKVDLKLQERDPDPQL